MKQAFPQLALTSLLLSALLVVAPASPAAAGGGGIVPALGSYKASGRGDPPAYTVTGQVKRRGKRRIVSVQVRDRCGGLASFARLAIGRSSGSPSFSGRIGGATVSGHWTGSTRIAGTVKTPCASAQAYVMRLTG